MLPSFLAGRIDALRDELTRALRDAFGAYADERPDDGGIAGHYLQ